MINDQTDNETNIDNAQSRRNEDWGVIGPRRLRAGSIGNAVGARVIAYRQQRL